MSFKEDLENYKAIEDTLTTNKVANFAYTDTAYENNDATGVAEYKESNEQNIPVATPSVLKVNETILYKGFRAKASSLTRMLINHFFGRVSYNLNKLNDLFSNLLTTLNDYFGSANGLATLDENARLSTEQLTESCALYKGEWNASTNTPKLVDGTGTKGEFYVVSREGYQTFNKLTTICRIGDKIIYTGTYWKIMPSGKVSSVNNVPSNIYGEVVLYGTNIKIEKDCISNIKEAIMHATASTMLGRYWKKADLDVTIENFCYVNNMWFGFSYGNNYGLYYSYDGKTWTRANSVTGHFYSVTYGINTYGVGIYVAVCDNARSDGEVDLSNNIGLHWSTDGINWTQGNLQKCEFTHVCYANRKWVAGSDGIDAITTDNLGLYYSTDGKNWTKTTTDTSAGAYKQGLIHWIEYANNIWEACDEDNIFYSTNGITWTKSDITTTFSWNKVLYLGGYWYGLSEENGAYYSTDGKAWTQITVGTSYRYSDAKYANGQWFFWSDEADANNAMYSVNGTHFYVSYISRESTLFDVHYVNGIWLIARSTGLYYSLTFEDSPVLISDTLIFYWLYYINGTWFGANNSAVYWSTDALTWTQANTTYSLGTIKGGSKLIYANGTLVMLSAITSTEKNIVYSDTQTLIDNGWINDNL